MSDQIVIQRRSGAVVGVDGRNLSLGLARYTPGTGGGLSVPVINFSGTSYDVTAVAINHLVIFSANTAIDVTLFDDATESIPIYSRIDFLQRGTGQATFLADGGATVNATPSLVLRDQWSACSALKWAADSWVIIGDMAEI